jgi:drug/metabolite transporter (DMT)-like permease
MTTPSPVSVSSSSTLWWRGLGFVLLATLALSCQNVIARIAQSSKVLPVLGGIFSLGGYIDPDASKLHVSLLVLLLRVSFVVPLLWLLLPAIKKGAWSEAKEVVQGGDRSLLTSQTSIYLAIASVGPATAVTIFFIYPTITTLLAWRLFGDRPSWQQWLAIVLIYTGCTWLAFSAPNASFKTDYLGIGEAVLSGVVFAMEGIIAQTCFNKINPLLAVTIPFVPLNINSGLLLMAGLLSLATLSGYLFNNFGIKNIGAASTAIIGSSGPAVTAILALGILGDSLQGPQWLSIVLVTSGVLLMNLAKLSKRT